MQHSTESQGLSPTTCWYNSDLVPYCIIFSLLAADKYPTANHHPSPPLPTINRPTWCTKSSLRNVMHFTLEKQINALEMCKWTPVHLHGYKL